MGVNPSLGTFIIRAGLRGCTDTANVLVDPPAKQYNSIPTPRIHYSLSSLARSR